MMGARYGRKRILAVDDAAFILSRIRDALGDSYDMVTVNSGLRALRYLEEHKPDLILLDIRMPVKDGFEILREIRSMEDRADIPIIMLTAMEDRQSVMKGIEMGVRDYVLKPFVPEDLLERVQRILESGAAAPAAGPEYDGPGAGADGGGYDGEYGGRQDGGADGPGEAVEAGRG